MRLSTFLRHSTAALLDEWDAAARSLLAPHRLPAHAELRGFAEEILGEIAAEIACPVAADGQTPCAPGAHARRDGDTAAERHAVQRLMAGYPIADMVEEFRALRSSVLQRWSAHCEENRIPARVALDEGNRFNAALDRALHESIARYSKRVTLAQDCFIGILGHDIRTPLAAISIGAETLMRSESLDAKFIQLASRIYNSSERINSLVDNLLDYTAARFGMKLSRGWTGLGMLAEQVIEEIRSAYPERTILLKTSGSLDGAWDGGRVSQVLSNLINNALQHGASGAVVTVSLAGDNEQVTLQVHNAGAPIPAEDLNHLFEPLHRYARAASSGRRPSVNLGLGLYIARKVVQAHAGTISVSSSSADGTCFTVHLPKQAG